METTLNKRLENDLKVENDRLKTVLNLVSNPIFFKDNDHKIILANPAFYEMFCLDEKNVIGKTLAENVPENEMIHFMKVDRDVLNTGVPNICEEELTVNGFTRTIVTGKTRYIDNNNQRFIVGSIHDITANKKSEQIIKEKNDELQLINLHKNKFFSIIAHDLKNPFASINGFCTILSNQVKKNNLKGIEEYADIIVQSSNHAMNLLMNLMEWCRSQTGKMEYNPEFLSTDEIIKENISLYTPIASNKEINIIEAPSVNTMLFADKEMIKTILRNLISNAIKFSYPNGTITISTKKEPNGLTFMVHDTGKGIPQNVLKSIFQIDNKHSTLGTQNEKGTGLGLILCKEFIEKHNGTIWVESEEEKGSTFYFFIPDIKEEEKAI